LANAQQRDAVLFLAGCTLVSHMSIRTCQKLTSKKSTTKPTEEEKATAKPGHNSAAPSTNSEDEKPATAAAKHDIESCREQV
jgi:hypothetical protein